MATARYWRLVGIETYGSGDFELSELHLYGASGRLDAAATLTASHAPTVGALESLMDADLSTSARFELYAVSSGGFYLQWDFGVAVEVLYPRIGATGAAVFLSRATLQYSADAVFWETDLSFGYVIYPGPGQYTPLDPIFRVQTPTAWDVASKGSATSIDGKTAFVASNFNGKVRTTSSRSSGRLIFGLRLRGANPPQEFFAGLAALENWGTYTVGKHWTLYVDGTFYYYPTGAVIASSLGTISAVGDTAYFDVNLDTGHCSIKKNDGAWSSPIALPNFQIGAAYVIELLAPSSSGASWGAEFLVSSTDLAGTVPEGALPWDSPQGTAPLLHAASPKAQQISTILAASSVVGGGHSAIALRAALARDIEHGGPGTIYGTTKTKGTPNLPTKARVVLQHQRSKLPVRETWSDPVTGYFEFRGIDNNQQFLTLAEDVDGNFRPVAANRLTPEVLA